MSTDTLAITAHKNSIANAMAGKKAQWLELFDENAVVHDPVGTSPHDPNGVGFRGKEEIARFWDLMIGKGNLVIAPVKRLPCGENIAAVAMTATNILDELKTYIDMVGIYEVNASGKIISLKVYWDINALRRQLAQAGAA
ncbi:nuclear transport factor 2 family protein [Steroidobacter denitrificans]|nr:nuclear transport factor 2 family protein [Steroidobacter denitrificans]